MLFRSQLDHHVRCKVAQAGAGCRVCTMKANLINLVAPAHHDLSVHFFIDGLDSVGVSYCVDIPVRIEISPVERTVQTCDAMS